MAIILLFVDSGGDTNLYDIIPFQVYKNYQKKLIDS